MAEPATPSANRFSRSIAFTASLAVAGAYAPFLLDYLLYQFWTLRPDPHERISGGFLWLVLVVCGLVVHIALGVKAFAFGVLVNLEAADLTDDRMSHGMAVIATILCGESLAALFSLFARLFPAYGIRVQSIIVVAMLALVAAIFVATFLRRVRLKANQARQRLDLI